MSGPKKAKKETGTALGTASDKGGSVSIVGMDSLSTNAKQALKKVAQQAKQTADKETSKAVKALGAVRRLEPQEIPKVYEQEIIKYFKEKVQGGMTPDVKGHKKVSASTDKVAGFLGFEGDTGIVVYVNEKTNNVSGIAGTLSWTIKSK